MTKPRIELMILSNLLYNETYTRRVLPYLEEHYFPDKVENVVFKVAKKFIDKYDNLPTKEAIIVELDSLDNIKQEVIDASKKLVKGLQANDQLDNNWLTDTTEEFCKERGMMHAIAESIKILEDPKKSGQKGNINNLVRDALSISFDQNVGHDYVDDCSERFEKYTNKEYKIPFGLEYFDKITDGGMGRQTLNIFMAGPGGGKTMAMCHMAASVLLQGKNVLYFSMEMPWWEITKRIDANLLDIPMKMLKRLHKDDFLDRVNTIQSKTTGKLKVKQYPSSAPSVDNFRSFMNDLKFKKGFIPDVVIIDYLGITASCHVERGAKATSTYAYVGMVAEEVRGFAAEMNVPVISAHQINREGMKTKDIGLEHSSDSMGVSRQADLFVVLIPTGDKSTIRIKQLKNRYDDVMSHTQFVVGVDRSKQRLYDISEDGQPDLSMEDENQNGESKEDDIPSFDKSQFKGEKLTKKKINDQLVKFYGRGKYVN